MIYCVINSFYYPTLTLSAFGDFHDFVRARAKSCAFGDFSDLVRALAQCFSDFRYVARTLQCIS